MSFDFERFTKSVKLAYRRCDGSAYSMEDILQVFSYYFETYELIMEKEHPMISIDQIVQIIEKMPFIYDDEYHNTLDIEPEDYKAIIDQHFVTKYCHCDYNINHFFSGRIREMRFYEVL